jgi:predicted solute-binding protein
MGTLVGKPKVCAVSYLNTVPLVWGMMHGPQKALVDLDFALPSECARQLASGEADIGIVPVGALLDGDYGIFRGTGIACRGAVRSILLISKVPFSRIRKLATDSGSRSSVLLCRIILSKTYNCEPECVSLAADLESMLQAADACLIIGDPALRLDPERLRADGYHVADLGEEWFALTGLPMVFAVWAGPNRLVNEELERAFVESYRFGREHIEDIVRSEYETRGISAEAAREYFDRYIVFELGEAEYAGMRRYIELAKELLSKQPVGSTRSI